MSRRLDSLRTLRRAPDFIVIGAMRAGTTALSQRLSAHPEIAMSRLKETDFFVAEKNFDRGLSWYQSLFPGDRPILGEASPNYTKNDVFKGVPERMRAVCPGVKLVYIVRDPVDRFWSHYAHSQLIYGGLPAPENLLDDPEGAHMLASSMYFRQLASYLSVFPRHQVYVADLDELNGSDGEAFASLLSFIGASTDVDLPRPMANSTRSLAATPQWALALSQHPALTGIRAITPARFRAALRRAVALTERKTRETPEIPASARARVADALSKDVEKLRSLTARKFAHWSI